MLSLTDLWLKAISGGTSEPRVRVVITVAAGVEYIFTSGTDTGVTAGYKAPGVIHGMSVLNREHDVWSRRSRVDMVTVNVTNDTYVEEMIYTYGVKGAHVAIKLGADSLVHGSYIDVLQGVVDLVINRGRMVDIRITTIAGLFASRKVGQGEWLNYHPRELIKKFFVRAEISSYWYDSATFDYDFDTKYSHFVVGQTNIYDYLDDKSSDEKITVKSISEQLASLVNGLFATDEDGKARLNAFDNSASAVFNWTFEDDFKDFEIVSLYDKLVNRINISGNGSNPVISGEEQAMVSTIEAAAGQAAADALVSAINSSNSVGTFSHEDKNSQSIFGTVIPTVGATDFIIEESINSRWCNGYTETNASMTDINPAAAATFAVGNSGSWAFAFMCGTRWPDFTHDGTAPAQAANAKLSGTRTAYLLIDSEVIECDLLVIDENRAGPVAYYDFDTDSIEGKLAPVAGTYTVKARGALGTTPAAHDINSRITDITIQVHMAQWRLDRFAYGAWMVKFKTPLDKFAAQLADIGTLSVPAEYFTAYGHKGLDATVKWEIVGKKISLISKNYIEWTLLKAFETAPPTPVDAYDFRQAPKRGVNGAIAQAIVNDDVINKHVVSGFTISVVAGLYCTVDEGVASSGASSFTVPAYDISVQANKDTYIGVCFKTRRIYLDTVATSAAEPTAPNDVIWVRKIVAAASISSNSDLGETTAMDGIKLAVGTVDSLQIASNAITNAKVATGAIDTDELAVFAVTGVKIDNLAVSEGKIASSAVTTTKIDDSAVTIGSMNRERQFGGSINPNHDLSDW